MAWMPVFLLLLILPHTEVTHDHCTTIEISHVYDDNANHTFSQLVFWDWNPRENRYDVRDWRIIKSKQQLPIHNQVIWNDGETIRRVTAIRTVESWEQWDVELQARDTLPTDQRRGLSPVISTRRAKELLGKER